MLELLAVNEREVFYFTCTATYSSTGSRLKIDSAQ